jgi:hypothetical protein
VRTRLKGEKEEDTVEERQRRERGVRGRHAMRGAEKD